MLTFDLVELEDFCMEEQVHLTITVTICGSIFAVIYYFGTLQQSYVAHEIGMMKKGFGGDWPAKQGGTHVPLGPHSYMTLILSIGCCAITLFIIYLIKVTPFEKLIKMMPIHKLIQILLNSKELEEEESLPRRLSQDQIASREKILATCRELEMRMTRLEQCIGPLVHSLERLTQHPDFQSASNEPVNASSETAENFWTLRAR
uniref:Exportin-T n=2 Tax=Lygus hesperus TaxID=30085 RepID=A0A0A9XIF9_LYGHE